MATVSRSRSKSRVCIVVATLALFLSAVAQGAQASADERAVPAHSLVPVEEPKAKQSEPAAPAAEVVTQDAVQSAELFTNADTTIFEPEEEWKEIGENQHLPGVGPSCTTDIDPPPHTHTHTHTVAEFPRANPFVDTCVRGSGFRRAEWHTITHIATCPAVAQ